MASLLTQVAKARLAAGKAALDRWTKRTAAREQAKERIRRGGPGAADPPDHVRNFRAHERRRFTERMIGGKWDATFFAPSQVAREIAMPVARITTLPGDGFLPEGFATGFMVSPRLFITNHHVFPSSASAGTAAANFLFEQSERGISKGVYFKLQPDKFYFTHAGLDIALVAVNPKGEGGERLADFGFVQMIGSTGKTLKGLPIHLIQHPNGGPRQYAVNNNTLLDILDEGFLHYETDTAPASSGSPAFNEHWELVAIHHCAIPRMRDGIPLKANGTPWDRENESEDLVEWLANEGTRVSFIVKCLQEATAVEGDRALLDELLALVPPVPEVESGVPPAVPTAPVPEPPQTPSAGQSPPIPGSKIESSQPLSHAVSNVFNITGPVTINITGAQSVAVQPAAPKELAGAEREAVLEVKQTFDPHYAKREGYDPDFLGVALPPPQVIPARRHELYSVADYRKFAASSHLVPKLKINGADKDPLRLDYHHYSLVFNKHFRMAAWTASNSDYRDDLRADPRSRKQFGGEDWKPDPRVPDRLQLMDADIYGPATNFDRGHVVRREDNCWGAVGNETAFANADTYHWTNCTAQHELFNQESPLGKEYKGRKGIWGMFEGNLQNEITKSGGRMTIFSGPVLDNSCVSKDFGKGVVRYPVKFWKVVAVVDIAGSPPKLKTYGFVFDQSDPIREFGIGFEEALVLAKFKKERKSLLKIQELAGIGFAPVLVNADQFA